VLKRVVAACMFVTVAVSAFADEDADCVVWAVMRGGTLTGSQMTTAQREVERIWFAYGVKFTWHDRLPHADEAPGQRPVVIRLDEQNFQTTIASRAPNALGATLKVGERFMQVIFISPRAAAEKVRGVVSYTDAPVLHEYLLARFIGRVIAHEFGHLMLNTTRHSSEGLMRHEFSRRDVLTDTAMNFHLDGGERLALFRPPVETAFIPAR
jgi:hypothetical protein